MPYFAFVDTDAVIVRKIDKLYVNKKGSLYTREAFGAAFIKKSFANFSICLVFSKVNS